MLNLAPIILRIDQVTYVILIINKDIDETQKGKSQNLVDLLQLVLKILL